MKAAFTTAEEEKAEQEYCDLYLLQIKKKNHPETIKIIKIASRSLPKLKLEFLGWSITTV